MSLRSVIKRHIIDSLRHVLLIKTFSIDNIHPAYVLLDICFQHVRTYVVRIVRWPWRSKNSSSSLDVFYSRHWPSLTSFNWQYLFVYIWNLFITNQMYITCSYIGPFAAFPPRIATTRNWARPRKIGLCRPGISHSTIWSESTCKSRRSQSLI